MEFALVMTVGNGKQYWLFGSSPKSDRTYTPSISTGFLKLRLRKEKQKNRTKEKPKKKKTEKEAFVYFFFVLLYGLVYRLYLKEYVIYPELYYKFIADVSYIMLLQQRRLLASYSANYKVSKTLHQPPTSVKKSP